MNWALLTWLEIRQWVPLAVSIYGNSYVWPFSYIFGPRQDPVAKSITVANFVTWNRRVVLDWRGDKILKGLLLRQAAVR